MNARILVVDDAATVRMYHCKQLRDVGWHTQEASNGVEALELLNQAELELPFDMLVVDINMPKMDGYRLVQQLRTSKNLTQLPVLMVSTESQALDSHRAFAAGVNSYLIKPVQPQALVLTAALMLGDVEIARQVGKK